MTLALEQLIPASDIIKRNVQKSYAIDNFIAAASTLTSNHKYAGNPHVPWWSFISRNEADHRNTENYRVHNKTSLLYTNLSIGPLAQTLTNTFMPGDYAFAVATLIPCQETLTAQGTDRDFGLWQQTLRELLSLSDREFETRYRNSIGNVFTGGTGRSCVIMRQHDPKYRKDFTFFVTIKTQGAKNKAFYFSGPLLCFRTGIGSKSQSALVALCRSLKPLPKVHEKKRSGNGVEIEPYIYQGPTNYNFSNKKGAKRLGPVIEVPNQHEWYISHGAFSRPFLSGTFNQDTTLNIELNPDWNCYNPAHIVRWLVYGY